MVSGGDNDVSISPQDISKKDIAGGVGALSSDKESKKLAIWVQVACMATALYIVSHSQTIMTCQALITVLSHPVLIIGISINTWCII